MYLRLRKAFFSPFFPILFARLNLLLIENKLYNVYMVCFHFHENYERISSEVAVTHFYLYYITFSYILCKDVCILFAMI